MPARDSHPVTVSGPGVDRGVASTGQGLSLAQTLASRADSPLTIYVRNGSTAYAVERTTDGTVYTTRTGGSHA